MDNGNIVEVVFSADEEQLYKLMNQRSAVKGMTPSEYLKDLVKVDLAWGQFANRGKNRKD